MDEKITFRKKAIRLLAISAGIFALELVILVLILNTLSNKMARAEEKKTLLLSFREERANFEGLERDYERVKPFTLTLENALPDEENLLRVLEALEGASKRFGGSISLNLQAQGPQPSGIEGVRFVNFSAVLEGGYDNLRNYLKEVARLPIFVDFDSIRISSPSSIFSGGTTNLSGKIYIK